MPSVANGRFQIVPDVVHPTPDQRFVLSLLQPFVGWVTDDREDWLAGLDVLRSRAFIVDWNALNTQGTYRRYPVRVR